MPLFDCLKKRSEDTAPTMRSPLVTGATATPQPLPPPPVRPPSPTATAATPRPQYIPLHKRVCCTAQCTCGDVVADCGPTIAFTCCTMLTGYITLSALNAVGLGITAASSSCHIYRAVTFVALQSGACAKCAHDAATSIVERREEHIRRRYLQPPTPQTMT